MNIFLATLLVSLSYQKMATETSVILVIAMYSIVILEKLLLLELKNYTHTSSIEPNL